MRASPKSVAKLILTLSLVILQGCAARSRHAAVPSDLVAKAIVSGMDYGIRYFPQDPERVQVFIEDYVKSMEREDAYYAKQGHSGSLPSVAMLAISGGGDNGAFAAGFLRHGRENDQARNRISRLKLRVSYLP